MEAFLKALLENSNAISAVVVTLMGAIAFIWAISTERLFSGPRGKEMQQTIRDQKEALDEARDELREVELDYERLRIYVEMQKGNPEWPFLDHSPRIQPQRRRRRGD